jgi:hypothetical protein
MDINQLVNNLFQQPNQPVNNQIIKGSLIMFKYSFWIHDPIPLVLVTDYNLNGKLRGVNLHYLTQFYILNLISSASNLKGVFSYNNIKNNSYIVDSFRSYKWEGISQIRVFDVSFISKMIQNVRNIDPTQVQSIRQSVNQQMQQQYVTPADQLTIQGQ